MLPEYPNFKTLELTDYKNILEYVQKHNAKICELALANLFIWQDFDHPKLTLINDNLCILINPLNEAPFFLEPIGENKIIDTLTTCLKDSGRIDRASEAFIFQLPVEQYQLTCSRNHFDYVYETKTLAELKGRKFDGKRNHIKNFKRRHPEYRFSPLQKEDKEKSLKLFEAWFAIRKASRYFPKLACTAQKNALERAFDLFEHLKLIGGAVHIDDKIKGFILGSSLNKNTAAVHFQYGHPAIQGIFQVLLWEACKNTFSDVKYINLEQDLGIPGLRKAKLSCYPLRLEKKFEIKPS